jgi:hypothetical protein
MSLERKARRAGGATGLWNVVSLTGNGLENSRSQRPPQAQSSLRLSFLRAAFTPLGRNRCFISLTTWSAALTCEAILNGTPRFRPNSSGHVIDGGRPNG